ncbi:MAG: CDP-diacylglycerol--glycerol-3-phosphate 3-phosphatidyltransferase [Acidobacteria bacterium]|jgi:CDP-diacylglycerol--glycerol-3-phosphate 3-phosphatidyltransferase|nr:CDP-diacylglycerol--glycerol-3-phosphate 3-phosphatidyltransferase [Acidobacteriota bacterium]
MNLPTSLTLLRILFVPLLVVVLLAPPWQWTKVRFFGEEGPPARELLGVLIFLIATLTDVLDGYLARRRNEVTTLGTLLDPIADKLLISAAFVSLVEMRLAPAWIVVIILGREFLVSGMRSILASRGFVQPASAWGKAKTVTQVVAIVLLILTDTILRLSGFDWLGIGVLWIAMLLTIASAVGYVREFVRLYPRLADGPPAPRQD